MNMCEKIKKILDRRFGILIWKSTSEEDFKDPDFYTSRKKDMITIHILGRNFTFRFRKYHSFR